MDPTTEYECVEELGLFGTYQFKEDSHYIGITPFLFQSLTGNDSPEFEAIKFKFAEDVLLHEMVHQFIIENDDWDANEE